MFSSPTQKVIALISIFTKPIFQAEQPGTSSKMKNISYTCMNTHTRIHRALKATLVCLVHQIFYLWVAQSSAALTSSCSRRRNYKTCQTGKDALVWWCHSYFLWLEQCSMLSSKSTRKWRRGVLLIKEIFAWGFKPRAMSALWGAVKRQFLDSSS